MRAISYLQLERTANGTVDSNDSVVFDRILSSGGDQIAYDAATGEIILYEPGYYYIDWFVAPQFGLTADGSNFAVAVSGNGPAWTGSCHVRVAPTIGFAVLAVAVPGTTFQLINTSDGSLTLSQAVNTKAALAIFTIAVRAASTA